jgi:hypothetical protein
MVGYEKRTSLGSDLLACTTDVAEEEGVEMNFFAVYDWVEGCIYTIFAALLAHVGES